LTIICLGILVTTPTPAAANTASCSFTNNFTYQDTDDTKNGEISALQRYLQTTNPALTVTGTFDDNLATALFDFQKQHKLIQPATAYQPELVFFGPLTRALISSQCDPLPVLDRNQTLSKLFSQLESIQQLLSGITSTDLTLSREAIYTAAHQCAFGINPSAATLSGYLKMNDGNDVTKLYSNVLGSAVYNALRKNNSTYLNDVYRCMLKRPITTNEQSAWLVEFRARTATRQDVVNRVVASAEFKASHPAISTVSSIDITSEETFYHHMYRCSLGRTPDKDGLQGWMNQTPTSMTLEKAYLGFFASAEYLRKNNSSTTYVTDLYSCILNRTPDPVGFKRWVERLDRSEVTRGGVIKLFVSSKEFQEKMRPALEKVTGYSGESSYLKSSSWDRWQGVIDPFAMGIPVIAKHFNPAKTNVNAGVYTTTPLLKDFWIGRAYTNGDPGKVPPGETSRWQLLGFRPSWDKNAATEKESLAVNQVNVVFDATQGNMTGRASTTIGDGTIIFASYDPSAMDFNGETWVAFECHGSLIGVNSCMGPLKAGTGNNQGNFVLDTARTVSIVYGESNRVGPFNDGEYIHSGSVPTLLNYKGRVYLYWIDVRRNINVPWYTNYDDAGNYLVNRGIELQYDNAAKRFYPKDANGRLIKEKFYAGDPRSVIVFDRDLSDPRSNRVADNHQVITDGTNIFIVGSKGGGRCLTPLSPAEGCYRPYVGVTREPLKFRGFNQATFVDEQYLPELYQSYRRFVYRPDTDSTWLVGGGFVVQNEKYLEAGLPIPKAKPAGAWAFPWPDNIMKPK